MSSLQLPPCLLSWPLRNGQRLEESGPQEPPGRCPPGLPGPRPSHRGCAESTARGFPLLAARSEGRGVDGLQLFSRGCVTWTKPVWEVAEGWLVVGGAPQRVGEALCAGAAARVGSGHWQFPRVRMRGPLLASEGARVTVTVGPGPGRGLGLNL